MADSILNVKGDTSSANKSMRDLETALNATAQDIEKYVFTMAKANAEGRVFEARSSALTKSGDVIEKTWKRVARSAEDNTKVWKAVQTTVKASSDALDEYANKARNAAAQASALKLLSGLTGLDESQLGNLGRGAPASRRGSLQSAQTRLVGTLASANLPEADVLQILERVKEGFNDVEFGARAKVQKALLDVQRAFDGIDTSAKKAGSGVDKVLKEMEETGKKAGKAWFVSFEGIVRLFETIVLRHIGYAIIQTVIGGLQATEKYMTEIRRASAIAGERTSLVDTSVSGAYNKYNRYFERDKVLEGYTSLSQQGLRGSAITETLDAGMKLSAASGIELNRALLLVSQAMRSYTTAGDDASKVTEKLYATMSKSGVNVQEFQHGFARLKDTAKDAGITLDETLAVFQYLSERGLETSQAISVLEAFIGRLLRPTKDMEALFQKWGVTSGENAIAANGFLGVLQKLSSEFQSGGLTKLGDLEHELRSIRGAFNLLSDPNIAEDLQKLIDKLQSSGNKAKEVADELTATASLWDYIKKGTGYVDETVGTVLKYSLFYKSENRPWEDPNETGQEMLDRREREAILKDFKENKRSESPTKAFDDETRKLFQAKAETRRFINETLQLAVDADRKIQSTLGKMVGEFSDSIGSQTQVVKKYLADASKEYDAAQKRLDAMSARHDQKLFERSISNLDPREQSRRTNERVDSLQRQAETSLQAGDVEKARDLLKEVEALTERTINRQQEFRRRASELGVKFSTPLDTAREDRAFKLQENIERGIMQTQLEGYKSVLKVAQDLNKLEQDTNRLYSERVEAFKKLFPGTAIPPELRGHSMGGFIRPQYFAAGGPVGTDVVPAWLSPGEYVMDAATTSKFFPQIVSMSMGLSPSYSHSNQVVNVGDININYQGTDSEKVDVRRLGEQLRRELRRGTLKLG